MDSRTLSSIELSSKQYSEGVTVAMQNLLNKYISNGFAEFEGLKITGSIPVKQEAINELLAEILQNGIQPAFHPQPNSSSSSKPNIDVNELLKLIKKAKIRADEGKIILEFEVGV